VQREVGGESAALGALLNNTARLKLLLDRRDEARPLLQESLQLQQRYAGEDSPAVAATHLSLGDLALADNRFDDAATHYRESMRLFESRLGAAHPLTARAKIGEAQRLARVRDVGASEAMFAQALEALEKAGAGARSYLASGQCRRAALRLERGALLQAATEAVLCQKLQHELREPQHYERIEADALSAAIDARQAGGESAKARHRAAVAQLTEVLGAANPRVQEARDWLR
jgi:hypothetical protein